MSEIEKCAWCGKMPGYCDGYHGHPNCACVYLYQFAAEDWNNFHALIMAQRRKDFDAGAKRCADGNGLIGWYGPNDFDDYIKGEE